MTFDVAIIGAGIAGASAAFFLKDSHRVVILERESQPGYHSTGRSVALFAATYGNAPVRALTRAARRDFDNPPGDFGMAPLLTPRGLLHVARADQARSMEHMEHDIVGTGGKVERLDGNHTHSLLPALRSGYCMGALFEPDATDIDVNATHQGFLRGHAHAGGELVLNAEVTGLARKDGSWQIETKAGRFEAGIVIDAAGAWGDEVAALAGIEKIGLVPKRRTIIQFPQPNGVDADGWPFCMDVDEKFYFKPDAGTMLGSPADETPTKPCDVQPEEMDVALAVDRIQKVTTFEIDRISHRWAGLRNFVPDCSFVTGFDSSQEGFFWLLAQGGWGIQTCFAMGRLVASMVRGEEGPPEIAAEGFDPASFSPERLRA